MSLTGYDVLGVAAVQHGVGGGGGNELGKLAGS